VGEPVYATLDTEDQERQLVTAVRRELCNRWWRSLGCVNEGRLSQSEFNRFVMREKRIWWRWNFGEAMPE
jgi:L-rhamnose mutarotase